MDQRTAAEGLLRCIRSSGDNTAPGEFERLAPEDWRAIIGEAHRHSLDPYLYWRLRTGGWEAYAPAVMSVLQQSYVLSAMHSTRLYHEVALVLGALQQAHVPVIALKGVQLAALVYEKTALRPMGDVDLLIRQQDRDTAEMSLHALGYVRSGWNTPGHIAHARHVVYQQPNTGLNVEVHWDVQETGAPFGIDVEGLWTRARAARIGKVEVLVLSPEDNLLYLCVHNGFRHLFEKGLRSLCDIAELARHHRQELDWGLVAQRARRWKASHCVGLTLGLAKDLVGGAIPDEVLRALVPTPVDPSVISWARRRALSLQDVSEGGAIPADLTSDRWGKLKASSRPGDKVAALLTACFPSPRDLAEMYSLPPNSRRVYLYYPLRLRDVFSRNVARAWQLLRRDPAAQAWIEQEGRRVGQETMLGQIRGMDSMPDQIARVLSWIEQDTWHGADPAILTWLAEG